MLREPRIPITPVFVTKRKNVLYGDWSTKTHFDDTTELAHKYLIIGTGSVTNCQYQHMWSYQLLHAVPKTPHQPYNTSIALAELVGHAQTIPNTNPVVMYTCGCLREFCFDVIEARGRGYRSARPYKSTNRDWKRARKCNNPKHAIKLGSPKTISLYRAAWRDDFISGYGNGKIS